MRHTVLMLASCVALAACGSGNSGSNAPAGDDHAANGPRVSGPAIRAVGSSTVYPFTTAVAENFKRRYPAAATPIVESTGTGGGIKLFCSGVGAKFPDIANASRRIKASEIEQCAKNGVKDIIELQIGLDGIAVAQARSAAPIALSLKAIWSALAASDAAGKPNRVQNWSDVDAKLAARKIEVLGPPPTSGTRDAFNELVMEGGCKAVPAVVALKDTNEDLFKERCTKLREDGTYVEAGENDNLIVQKLVANPVAIGVFGYSYMNENADKIVGLAIDGVLPTYENIASGKYPASRPLYIYVKGEHVRAKPALKLFLAEFTSDGAVGPKGYLSARGLIAAPDDVRAMNTKVAQELTPLDPAQVN